MSLGELRRWLEPQERFDALQAQAGRLGSRVVDLSYANFDGPLDPGVREVLERALATDRNRAFQYTPFGGSRPARRAVADGLGASHGPGYDWRDVVLTCGATAALSVALHAVGEPGSEVVVPVPCWFDHPLYAAACGKAVTTVPLRAGDFALDVGAVERALTPRTAAVVLANPANPTGRCYGAAALADLAMLLADTDRRLGTAITVVADETHRDLAPCRVPTLPDDARTGGFTSSTASHDRTLVVYSFGKYHGLQGQRLGYVVVPPVHPERSTVRDDLVRWVRVAGNLTPTALMQLAVPGLLALRHDTTVLDGRRARYLAGLQAAGYEVVQPDGTYFVYVRTPGDIPDEDWARTLLHNHKVLVAPAPLFHHQGYFRLALTATTDRLDAALAALMEAAPPASTTQPARTVEATEALEAVGSAGSARSARVAEVAEVVEAANTREPAKAVEPTRADGTDAAGR